MKQRSIFQVLTVWLLERLFDGKDSTPLQSVESNLSGKSLGKIVAAVVAVGIVVVLGFLAYRLILIELLFRLANN